MRKIVILTIFIVITHLIFSMDKRLEMQKLIINLSNSAKRRNETFVILLQNPKKIIFSDNDEVVNLISGITVEEYFFGFPKLGDISPPSLKAEVDPIIKSVEDKNKKILYIDYLMPSQYSDYKQMIKSTPYQNALFYHSFSKNLNTIESEASQVREVNSFNDMTSFTYFINPEKFISKQRYFEAIKKCHSDLIVIDPDYEGVPLNSNEVEYLSLSDVGTKRFLFAYLSIGEAESYRNYWRSEWNDTLPSWIVSQNPNWKNNYVVKYWSSEWYDIVKKQMQHIVDVGFSGVVLDTLDSYEVFEEGGYEK